MEQPGASSTRSPRGHTRAFSYRSDKSSGSKKEEIVESPAEKERRGSFWKGGSKANPNAAITEAQPGDQAILERSTLTPLRSIQHVDSKGVLIADPDLSNPTRPRMERPLDTIRSFERAIDQGYKRRTSMRSESYDQSTQAQSRRGSYYGGHDNNGSNGNRYGQSSGGGGGYYGQQRNDGYGNAGPSNARPRYNNGNRMQSEPGSYNQRSYPQQHAYQQSQDTMYTGGTNGSDSTGPWANSTDPSSENSSVERNQQGYNGNAFQGGIPEEGGAYPMRGNGAPPIPPHKDGVRKPINLSSAPPPPAHLPQPTRPQEEKRQSWLKRRFSRNP